MKQMTATILTYRPFGAAETARCVQVMYRRNCLVSFGGDDESELKDKCAVWAYNQGFTKLNFKNIVEGCV
jgi:hypothetical protein